MNKYDFTALVKGPKSLGTQDVESLKLLVAEFPYFAVGQNLLIKALHNTKHYEYEKYLKQAALQTGDRSVLYNLVHDLPPETESSGVFNDAIETLKISIPKVQTLPNVPIGEPLIEKERVPEIVMPAEPVETPATVEPIVQIIQELTEPIVTEPEFKASEYIEEKNIPEEKISEPEPVVVEPEPQLSNHRVEEVPEIISPPKPVRFIIPEDEPEPLPPPVVHKEIESEEKLVPSTGNFVRYIPKYTKPAANENSIIDNVSDQEDLILNDFDISSLEDISVEVKTGFVPGKNILADKEKPKEGNLIEYKSIPQTEEHSLFEEAIHKVDSGIARTEITHESGSLDTRDGITNPVDSDFLNWLNKKRTKPEPIDKSKSEPVHPEKTVVEDVQMIHDIQNKLSKEAGILLHDEIAAHQSAEPVIIEKSVELEILKPPIDFVEPEVQEQKVTPQTVVEIKQETQISEIDMLKSLQNYDVNEFLAPLYTQVSYNNQIFEESFDNVFDNVYSEPKTGNISYQDIPFVVLKPNHDISEPVKEPSAPKNIPRYQVEEALVKPKITEIHTPKIQRDSKVTESILDKFIRENPTIARPKSEFYSPLNMARQSAEDNTEMVSETLAQIYTRQALYKKAILMYEKLGLLYPDKLSYFAGLINQIKTEHNIE
ncbi:MAG: hypothetical protein Q8M15_05550 [Bacteroidota bacterium]|nr:hypothetical protein [Bacteroidota bacterium]